MGPRWPSQQVVERGLAAGQGPQPTPASGLSSHHRLREEFLIIVVMSSCFLLPCVSAC